MAQFDVFEGPSEDGLLLDCQSDVLSDLNTRLAVPLMLPSRAPAPGRNLNPEFEVAGERYLMVTQYTAAIEVGRLGRKVASLESESHRITNALDFLITGV